MTGAATSKKFLAGRGCLCISAVRQGKARRGLSSDGEMADCIEGRFNHYLYESTLQSTVLAIPVEAPMWIIPASLSCRAEVFHAFSLTTEIQAPLGWRVAVTWTGVCRDFRANLLFQTMVSGLAELLQI